MRFAKNRHCLILTLQILKIELEIWGDKMSKEKVYRFNQFIPVQFRKFLENLRLHFRES